MHKWFLPLLLFLFMADGAEAKCSAEEKDKREIQKCMQLYAKCSQLHVLIKTQLPVPPTPPLAEPVIRAVITNRLRFHNLYHPKGNAALHVTVSTFEQAFLVIVAFKKNLKDTYTPFGGLGTTWTRIQVGNYRRSPVVAIAALVRMLDLFISEYLKANGEHCPRVL